MPTLSCTMLNPTSMPLPVSPTANPSCLHLPGKVAMQSAAGQARAHIPLPANSLQSSSRHEKEFQKYIHAPVWKDNIADKPWKKLNTIRPGEKIINTLFIVLEKQRTTLTKEGNTVHHIVIADNTAKMNASLFDTYGELVQPGDIVRLTGGYCSLYYCNIIKNQVSTLYAGKHGKIERIGEFCFPFTDKHDQSDNMSRLLWVQQGQDTYVPKQTGPGTPLP